MLSASEPHRSAACRYFMCLCPPMDIAHVKWGLFQLNVILMKVRRERVAAVQRGIADWPSRLTYFCQESVSGLGLLASLNLYFRAQRGGFWWGRWQASTLLAFSLPCAQGHKHWAKVSPGSSEVHVSPDTNIVSSISLFQLLGQRLSFRVIPEGSVPNLNLRDFNQDYLTLYFQMIWGKPVGGLKWK